MKRRDFIKSVGAAGMFSLLGIVTLHGSANADSKPPAGSGAGENPGEVGLKGPFALAFAPSGDLLITDPPGYRVVRLHGDTKPLHAFGKPGSQIGRLNFPKGIAVDANGLTYVVDSNNCRIQVFDEKGAVKRAFGSIGSIGGSFSNPQGIRLDGKDRVLVADTRNHRIQIFENLVLMAVLGDLGDDEGQFRLPTDCAVRHGGEILVLDSKHGLVKIFGKDLKFKGSFGGIGNNPGQFNMPQGMALDDRGNVWVADTGNHRIQQFDPEGKFLSAVGKSGSAPGELNSPTGVTCRGEKVYVADNGNKRIQVIVKS